MLMFPCFCGPIPQNAIELRPCTVGGRQCHLVTERVTVYLNFLHSGRTLMGFYLNATLLHDMTLCAGTVIKYECSFKTWSVHSSKFRENNFTGKLFPLFSWKTRKMNLESFGIIFHRVIYILHFINIHNVVLLE